MGVDYRLIRSDRKTIAIQIGADGAVTVRAPRFVTQQAIDRFVDSRRRWIETRLEAFAARPSVTPLSAEELAALVKDASVVLPQRVAFLAPIVGVRYGRVTIRRQRTRWGSCSGKGNLNFNCLVMLMPPDVRDYIVVHELCHLLELNHSACFWTQVKRVLPDYKVQERWIKEHGAALIERLPRKDTT